MHLSPQIMNQVINFKEPERDRHISTAHAGHHQLDEARIYWRTGHSESPRDTPERMGVSRGERVMRSQENPGDESSGDVSPRGCLAGASQASLLPADLGQALGGNSSLPRVRWGA